MTKKKRSSSQNFYELPQKLQKIRAVNTNLRVLGLDLHSNCPEPVNFFGAQSSLGEEKFSFGGAQAVIWGKHGPRMPPRGAGSGQGPRAQTFFGLHLHLAGKHGKNPKVPVAQLNANPARAITWFVGVTIYCTFFNNDSPAPRQFLCSKILLKKISYSKGNAYCTKF